MRFIFFFNWKWAYEVSIGDWWSDVCSSDLSFKEMLVLIRRPCRQGQAGGIRRVSSTIDGRLTARRPTCFGVHGSKGARATDRPGLHIAIKNIHEQHTCFG